MSTDEFIIRYEAMTEWNSPALCPDCGHELTVHGDHKVIHGQIVWYRSYVCGTCGYLLEEDGVGRNPELIEELLATEGEFILLITQPDDLTRGRLIIRQLTGLPHSDLLGLRDVNPTCVARGARVELEWLQWRLQETGITAKVEISE